MALGFRLPVPFSASMSPSARGPRILNMTLQRSVAFRSGLGLSEGSLKISIYIFVSIRVYTQRPGTCTGFRSRARHRHRVHHARHRTVVVHASPLVGRQQRETSDRRVRHAAHRSGHTQAHTGARSVWWLCWSHSLVGSHGVVLARKALEHGLHRGYCCPQRCSDARQAVAECRKGERGGLGCGQRGRAEPVARGGGGKASN